jgi:hypothetical protein
LRGKAARASARRPTDNQAILADPRMQNARIDRRELRQRERQGQVERGDLTLVRPMVRTQRTQQVNIQQLNRVGRTFL